MTLRSCIGFVATDIDSQSPQVVLGDLALLHSVYFCNTEELECLEWMEKRSEDNAMSALWMELLKHAHYEFPEFWSKPRYIGVAFPLILLYTFTSQG